MNETKIQQLKSEIEATAVQLDKPKAELDKAMIKEPSIEDRWEPSMDETFFSVAPAHGHVYELTWRNDCADSGYFDFYNCWVTRKRAEGVAQKVKLLFLMEQIHDILCPDYKHDWGNNRLMSNGVEYDNSKNIWHATIGYPCAIKGFTHFDTLEHAKQAAKILNDMGVKPV